MRDVDDEPPTVHLCGLQLRQRIDGGLSRLHVHEAEAASPSVCPDGQVDSGDAFDAERLEQRVELLFGAVVGEVSDVEGAILADGGLGEARAF
jgi:hypothetical protein